MTEEAPSTKTPPTRLPPTLRARAEERMREGEYAQLPDGELKGLVHELHVHQIELELQNEELGRSRTALEALKGEYFDLYDRAPVGYLTLDEGGFIQQVNLRGCEMLNATREDLIKQSMTSLIHPDDRQLYHSRHEAASASGEPQVSELRVVRRDGSMQWTRLEQGISHDERVRPVCRTVLSDITETRALQERLSRAEQMASMGTLAAGLAHEVNNPLTYVLHSAEMLHRDLYELASHAAAYRSAIRERMGTEDFATLEQEGHSMFEPEALEALCELAGRAATGALRIGEITNRLGNFARREPTAPVSVDLNESVEEAVAMAANQVRARANLELDLGTVPPVRASKGQLTQILLNLLANATQAIEEGAPTTNRVGVRTWAESGYALVAVEDTGCGISQTDRANIFEPFFTTKAQGRGTGLGLAMVRRSVDELGGEIEVTSATGQGTRFVVRLPTAPSQRVSSAVRSPVPRPRGRVLVVDDEAMILVAIESGLKGQHEVVTARSGHEATALLAGDMAFDLVLCDLVMPDGTGIDVQAWLTKHNPSLARRLVLMTGGVFTPQIQSQLDGIDTVRIAKPFRMRALIDLVDQRVSAHRSPEVGPKPETANGA